MKTTILFLLIAVIGMGQPQVGIWRIKPDTICAGDTLRINYKFSKPQNPDATTNYIYLDGGVLFQGNWSLLDVKTKEHWAALAPGDSAYLKKFKTNLSITIGTHTITTPNGGPGMTFYVKNCCTLNANFTYTNNNGIVTYSSTTTGTNTPVTYQWDLGDGTGFQSLPATFTYTFNTNQTYSTTLFASAVNCTSTVNKPVVVTHTVSTVGIEEYELNTAEPIYFDLYGNRIEKRANAIIIEQIGLKRRKIVIQE